jgi:DNA-binding transcriptional regulator YhcF (GntR family)
VETPDAIIDAAFGRNSSPELRIRAIEALAKELGISVKVVDATLMEMNTDPGETNVAERATTAPATAEAAKDTNEQTTAKKKEKTVDPLSKKGVRRENLQDLLITLLLMRKNPNKIRELWEEHKIFIESHHLLDPFDSEDRPVYAEVRKMRDDITEAQLERERMQGMPARRRRGRGAFKVTSAGVLLGITAAVRYYVATRGIGAEVFDGIGTSAYVLEAVGAAQWQVGKHYTHSPSEHKAHLRAALTADDAARGEIAKIRGHQESRQGAEDVRSRVEKAAARNKKKDNQQEGTDTQDEQ